MDIGEFSVCQFFAEPVGQYEYVCRFVSAREAVKAFASYISSVGAKMGTTVRVIITDSGDAVNAEWQHGKGILFPPEWVGKQVPVKEASEV